jgi:alpha-tubulin suppressor-like RCC1 family protein
VSLSASHGNNINTGNICGLTAAGRAYCWGTTGPGAYGAPTPDTCNPFGGAPRQCSRVPSPVGFGPDFMQIDVGGTEARLCGVTTDGDAYCVGHGVNGELGNGTMASSGGFVPVSGGHKWLQISVGNRQTCGLTTAGEVWCWGANDHGLLGDGTTDASAVPVRVASSAAYRFVNAGFERGCAITISDEVHCWGERDVYTLPGNLGSTPDVLVPTSVAGAPAAVSVEIGIENFCAITPAQEAWCWGYDRGQGSMASGRAYQGQPYVAPARVAISGSITELAAGLLHTCVRLSSGTIACAGSNIFGQLGLGVTGGPFVLSPIPVVRPGAAGPPVSMSALVDTLLWRSTPTGARPTFYDATGRSWPYDPSVLVTDAAGRGVPGVTVIWSPLTPGSSVPGSNTTLTDASGRATQTGWVLGPAAGRYTLQASVNGIVTALRFHADAILPGPPATLLTSPQELAGGLGEVTASLLLARVMDANSFALAGVPVQVTRSRATAPPSQSVPAIPGTFTTDALGEVRITTWTFDTVQVLDTVSVHVPGITTAPQVAFVLYSANRPEVTSLPETITAGQPIDSPIEIEIRDWNGNLDASFNGTVFLGATSQTTSLSLGTVTATGGRAVFAGAVFPEAGTYTLSAFVQYLGRFGRSYGQLATVVVAP